MSLKSITKEKIFIKLTLKEQSYYSKIFDLLDNKKTGKIPYDLAQKFIKESKLDDNILKQILLLSSFKNIKLIEKEEFFKVLRLIALAQNKIPFNVESLEKNNPIPPLPIFHFIEKNNLINKRDIFEITEKDEKGYSKIFYEIKDTRSDYISRLSTLLFWNEKNPKEISEKIMKSLEPLNYNHYLNLKEFIVGNYLLSLSKFIPIPKQLPKIILDYLGRKSDKNKNYIKASSSKDIGYNELKKEMNVNQEQTKDNYKLNNSSKDNIINVNNDKIDYKTSSIYSGAFIDKSMYYEFPSSNISYFDLNNNYINTNNNYSKIEKSTEQNNINNQFNYNTNTNNYLNLYITHNIKPSHFPSDNMSYLKRLNSK